ncbi:hypothetical protein ABDF71_25290 [Ochrobactrum sp. WV_118_8]
MTNKIDFSSWRTTKSSPNVFGKTIKIDGDSYSIEISRTNEGRGLWLFQRRKYDAGHGKFDKQIKGGLADSFEDGYHELMTTVHAYASFMHDVDLSGWQRNLNSPVETYFKTVEIGDQEYAVEIRRISDTKSAWRITQGDYDGSADNLDAEIMSGKARTLKDAYVAALDACQNYEPPASPRF